MQPVFFYNPTYSIVRKTFRITYLERRIYSQLHHT